MYVSPDKFAASQQAGINSLLEIAEAQFAAIEKFAALTITAAKTSLDEVSEHVKSIAAVRDPPELLKLTTAFAQPALEKSAAYGKHVYDIATQATASFTKLAEAQTIEANRMFAGLIDQVSKNAPAGSDPYVTAMKSAFAAANSAYDNFSKVAKQAADVVEVNFAASGAKARRKA